MSILQTPLTTACTLGASTLAFMILIRMLVKCRREVRTVRDDLAVKQLGFDALSQTVADLAERVDRAEDRAGLMVPPAPCPSGLNLAKRTQAMRMLNRGADVKVVAGTLSLPRPEVALLARIRNLAAGQAGAISVPEISPHGRSGLFRAPAPARAESSS